MKSPLPAAWLAAGLLSAPVLSLAAAPTTTATFTGTGEICSLADPFNPICTSGVTLSGSITMQEVGAPDSGDGVYEANGDHWVESAISVQWSGPVSGTFTFARLPNATVDTSSTSVWNDYPYFIDSPPTDYMVLGATSGVQQSLDDQTFSITANTFSLVRQSEDASWLSSLAFNPYAGVAPIVGPYDQNLLTFSWASGIVNEAGIVYVDPNSFGATFQLDSWTITAVPEPGTWALFGAGALGLLARLRRRRPA